MNNIVETAPYEEYDDKTEALLERECLFRELEVARTEMSTLGWCIARMEHALYSDNPRSEIRELIEEARDWSHDSEENIAVISERINNLKEEM